MIDLIYDTEVVRSFLKEKKNLVRSEELKK